MMDQVSILLLLIGAKTWPMQSCLMFWKTKKVLKSGMCKYKFFVGFFSRRP